MIIPTPKYVETKGDVKQYPKNKQYRILLEGAVTERMKFGAKFLSKKLADEYGINFKVGSKVRAAGESGACDQGLGENDILIINDTDAKIHVPDLTEKDMSVFDTATGREQGYIIKSRKKSPIILYGRNDLGCLYSVSSAIQLFEKKANVVFPDIAVRDCPDFRYRGNNWLIWAEGGVWSYDYGDGLDNYVRRVMDKLDMSLLYKINAILFDGVGWSKEKFPGYGKLMGMFAKEARLRGIKLVYGGYQEGYGAAAYGAYHGEVFKNRREYPDGEVYSCCGGFGGAVSDDHPSRIYGTCLSNCKLMELKQKELENFVRSVEPGMMWLHSLDIGNPENAEKLWKLRCPECRKRWPNDDIYEEDGMLGARAHLFNSFIDAITKVKKPGYDASKDCNIIFVGPIYGAGQDWPWKPNYTSKGAWTKLVKFFVNLSRLLKNNETALLGIREHFYNPENNIKQMPELKEQLDKNGKGNGLWDIWFYGADGALNDLLFSSVPVLCETQAGVEVLQHASGHGFQEPQQLMNAEYSWNSRNSLFHREKISADFKDFVQVLRNYCEGKSKPKGIYGKGGFIDVACRKLYGEKAGSKIAGVYKLSGKNAEPPVCFIWNLEFKMGVYGGAPQWGRPVKVEDIMGIANRLKEVEKMSEKADKIMQGVNTDGASENISEHIEWLKKSFQCGARYSNLFRRYYGLFYNLAESIGDYKGVVSSRMKKLGSEINMLLKDVEQTGQWVENNFSFKTIDPFGGDSAMKKKALVYLRENLAGMSQSAKTGKIEKVEPNKFHWW